METGAITGYIDVAQVALYVFWLFFAGLIFYLRREDRREGYPLERDDGTPEDQGIIWLAKPKEFNLPHGRGTAYTNQKDKRDLKLKPIFGWDGGSPFEPTGDPMADGVGPAAYAEREDEPDLTLEGTPKIVPLKHNPDFYPCDGDDDPRGMTVFGADGQAVGTVKDLWIDKADLIARYLEVELSGGGAAPAPAPAPAAAEGDEAAAPAPAAAAKTAMLPREFMRVRGPNSFFSKLLGVAPKQPGIYVSALNAEHFQKVPAVKSDKQITAMEEERITAYFGGGRLYATKAHEGPMI